MNLQIVKNYFDPQLVLDIGGNTGGFYELFKQFYPDAHIHIIEANMECKEALDKLETPYLIRLLGKARGITTFYRTRNNDKCTGNSIYKEITSNYNNESVIETVEDVYTLDETFNEEFSFDLIKLDTQGSELDILEGGPRLCKKAKGILMEVSFIEYNQGAPLYHDVAKFMDNYGFYEADTLSIVTWERDDIKFDQRDILFLNKSYFSRR